MNTPLASKTFFPSIPYVRYQGSHSSDPMSFRWYNPDEVILGKPMRDQLKFAMSYWHTMCAGGADMFGRATNVKTYGESDPMKIAEAKAYAAFEFMNKLSIDWFCFHDRDLAPEGATLAESSAHLDEIAGLLEILMAKRSSGARRTVSTTRAMSTAPGQRPTPTCSRLPRHRSKKPSR